VSARRQASAIVDLDLGSVLALLTFSAALEEVLLTLNHQDQIQNLQDQTLSPQDPILNHLDLIQSLQDPIQSLLVLTLLTLFLDLWFLSLPSQRTILALWAQLLATVSTLSSARELSLVALVLADHQTSNAALLSLLPTHSRGWMSISLL